MAKITVLGAGAWGSTMAQVLADGANDVLLWGRREEVVAEINTSHTNTKYLGSQVLPESLKATSDINEAFAHSKYIVLAIPAQRESWQALDSSSLRLVTSLSPPGTT